MADIEETIKRIQSQKGVVGIIIMDKEGRSLRSTLDQETTSQHSILLQHLNDKAKNVIRELDPSNDLTFLRLRTKKNEIIVALDKDYLLVVIQNPNI